MHDGASCFYRPCMRSLRALLTATGSATATVAARARGLPTTRLTFDPFLRVRPRLGLVRMTRPA